MEITNTFNRVTPAGFQKATNKIMELLGARLVKAAKWAKEDAEYDCIERPYLNQEVLDRVGPAIEVFDNADEPEVLEDCLELLLHIYCDEQFDDTDIIDALDEIEDRERHFFMKKTPAA